ncbi:MAG TPA: ABC transporter permease [Opitutus sp.]|nr:ABC transporter permease [Opitutus sp.]
MPHALRSLAKARGFTAVAVLIVALGIGAATAMFSTVDALVLRPIALPQPDRLVAIYETNLPRNLPWFSCSYPNYIDWRERSQNWEALAAMGGAAMNLTGGDAEPEFLYGITLTANFLPMLGVQPMLGRNFLPEEDQPGRNRVALVSHDFWQRRFGGAPNVIGQTLQLNGTPHTIVGVLPADAFFPGHLEVAVPMGADLAKERRSNHEISVFGRLKPGVTVDQAEAELKTIAAQIERSLPESEKGWSTRLIPLMNDLFAPELRAGLLLLLAAVGLLLLITCANLSNLLLVRATSRAYELAVRTALGATRAQIARQIVVESLLVTGTGGALGVLLSLWAVDTLQTLPLPRAGEITVDLRVLAVACAATLLTGLASALGPALRAARAQPQDALKGRSPRSGHRSRWRDAMVVAQLAISLALLVGATLLGRSFARLLDVQPGFNPAQVLAVSLRPADNERAAAFYERLTARVASLPGVTAAGVISSLPLTEGNTSNNLYPVGPSVLPPDTSVQCSWRLVGGGYFDAMQIPLLRGRTHAELPPEQAAQSIVLSASLARALFGDADPVGRQVANIRPDGQRLTVIGIVGDVRSQRLGIDAAPTFYWSMHRFIYGPMHLVVRSSGELDPLLPAVRAAVKELDPNVPVFRVRTLEQIRAASLEHEHFILTALGAFTAMALLLCALGIYGVSTFMVQQRTPEFGIRLALGAQARDIFRLVLGHGAGLIALGTLLGFAGALAMSRLLTAQLYGVDAHDVTSYALAALALAAVALGAAFLPARRATKVNPLTALRAE